jgi:outer membrane beta-barrel protein
LNLGVAINVIDSLAIELRGGYAFTRHTGLADQISADFFQSVVAGGAAASAPVTDMSDLWEMTGNADIGMRWQPIYGKISLFSEAALHFQFYVWLGGGAAIFSRRSIIICNERAGGECSNWYTETKPGPVVELALGMRFFLPLKPWVPWSGAIALRVEARTYSWLDSYLQGVNRVAALNGATPDGNGTPSPAAGITTLSQIDFGPTFIF